MLLSTFAGTVHHACTYDSESHAQSSLTLDEVRDAAPSAPDAATRGSPPVETRCPRRAVPPQELASSAVARHSAQLRWNGREWGASWIEETAEGPALFFVRISAEGRRHGPPVRVSERGARALEPAMVWAFDSWFIAFAGGPSRTNEIWLARVDANGAPLGRPRRITARARDDRSPALMPTANDLLLVWAGRLIDGHYALLDVRLNRWGVQAAPPTLLAMRRDRPTQMQMLQTARGYALAWVVVRNEVRGVDMMRVEPDGLPRGYPTRVTLAAVGGTDTARRFGVDWDGERFGVVWDEMRDGVASVVMHTVHWRLDSTTPLMRVSAAEHTAASPAVLSIGRDQYVVAYQVERGSLHRVRVESVGGDGHRLADPVEVQGLSGDAGSPTLATGIDSIGLLSVTADAIHFHRLMLGPCNGALPEAH